MTTAKEFNKKYKEYLKEGYYGLHIDTPKVVDFLDRVFMELTLIPEFKYYQIKLKFGKSRFYSSLKVGALSYVIEQEIDKIIIETLSDSSPLAHVSV
jgi:hypothetical protein